MKKITLLSSIFCSFYGLCIAQTAKIDSFDVEKEIVKINDLKERKSARQRSNELNEDNSKSAAAHMAYNDIMSGNGSVRTYDLRYEGVKGSRYFIDRWTKGLLEFSNGTIGQTTLKYNALDKSVLMYRNKLKDSLEIYSYQINAFALVDENNNSYVFKKYSKVKSELGTIPEAYLQVLSEGNKVNFLKLVSKRIKDADFKGAYSNDVRYDSFIDNSEFFLSFNEKNDLVRVKKNKKSIVKALKVNGFTSIEKFISENKLELKNDTEISKLIEHVNDNK